MAELVKIVFVVCVFVFLIACVSKEAEFNYQEGTGIETQKEGEFNYRFVKEKSLTGPNDFFGSGYYPDIECFDGNLFVSFRGSSSEQKYLIELNEELEPLNEPIKLMPGPDHEIVFFNDFFYFAVNQSKIANGKELQSLVLAKYDKEFNLIKSVYVVKDSQEECNDQALTLCENNLCLMNPAYPPKNSSLRIYNLNLELLEEHEITPWTRGNVIWLKEKKQWVIIDVAPITQTNTSNNEPPGEKMPLEERRIIASFFDEKFNYLDKKILSTSENYEDPFQGMPYDLKKIGNHYFITHNSAGADSTGGKFKGEGYVSIFNENLDFEKKIRISTHDTEEFSISFPRFCEMNNKLFFVYGLLPDREAFIEGNHDEQEIHLTVFEKIA